MPYPSAPYGGTGGSPGSSFVVSIILVEVSAAVSLSITLIESSDRELLLALRTSGYRVAETSVAEVASVHPAGLEGSGRVPRRHPRARGAAARPGRPEAPVPWPPASSCSPSRSTPTRMLEAMRLGITEWLPEPVDAGRPRRRACSA